MKEKILDLLKKNDSIYFPSLSIYIPEIAGEYAIYMSVKQNVNPNILWLNGVSQDFIKVFNELLVGEKLIKFTVDDIGDILFRGLPIYSLPLASKRNISSKIHCWLPIWRIRANCTTKSATKWSTQSALNWSTYSAANCTT